MDELNLQPDQRVLVVEDEQRLRDGLLRAIPAMGFGAVGAATAEQAIGLLEQDPPPLMILDLRLPDQGGMDLFEEVRQRWPQTQVIILTGFGDLDAARRAIHLSVAEFLTKPCSLHDLELGIDRAWRRYVASRSPVRAAVSASPPRQPDEGTDEQAGSGNHCCLEDVQRQHILQVLHRHKGNRTTAAEELGISRRTLQYRVKEYKRKGLLKSPQ